MTNKRGQILCTSDPGIPESAYCDETFGRMSRKRHCSVRSLYEESATGRRDSPARPSDSPSSVTLILPDEEDAISLHELASEWSEKIVDGLRRMQSTQDLKEPLANYLTQFYHAAISRGCEDTSQPENSQGDQSEELSNRIGQLLHRNNVLCNVIRNQYETIRRLQASEVLASSLMREKVALRDELLGLKECVNAYVGSVGAGSSCGPCDSHFTRRPPDVF
ncbi:dynein heavy chain 5 axonemal, putative [Babesia ovata]|uniref:Dynein heavy chain 5 axonemal, putative n=1 Tax=Babesia ovata TaxID=189622 RepID=A0A2H6K7M3_9APIC|nr:dynein heavy chain 5 axonemal, putative [Babesia ovata]GBE59002.1 dynein heavy chain 5 axonemal, putative [Babesia ovata]